MALFRRTARRVVAQPIAQNDLPQSVQPSLFLAGILSRRHSDQASDLVVAPHGSLGEVGFVAGWGEAPTSRPPRDMRFCRNFYDDRSFAAQPGDCGTDLARVEIKEALVYDTYQRGTIDYTGFAVTIIFAPEAYRLFAEIVEIDKPRDWRDNRGFVLSLPTPAFAFPAQRGSPNPGGAKIEYVKELRPIKMLELREMVVAVANVRTYEPADNASFLDRFEILSATKLRLVTD